MSPGDLAALQGAAARFLDSNPAPPGTRDTVTAALGALAEAAPPGAAGLSSGCNDDYTKIKGTHFMVTWRPGV